MLALKGRAKRVDTGLSSPPFRAIIPLPHNPQGVALGCHIPPLQGLGQHDLSVRANMSASGRHLAVSAADQQPAALSLFAILNSLLSWPWMLAGFQGVTQGLKLEPVQLTGSRIGKHRGNILHGQARRFGTLEPLKKTECIAPM